jgi:pyruvate,orthophosphate dikinase
MSRLGLPVPPGFVITTETCLAFFSSGNMLPPGLKEEYLRALNKVRQDVASSLHVIQAMIVLICFATRMPTRIRS